MFQCRTVEFGTSARLYEKHNLFASVSVTLQPLSFKYSATRPTPPFIHNTVPVTTDNSFCISSSGLRPAANIVFSISGLTSTPK